MRRIILALFFLVVIFVTAKPIDDTDIFWHLRTGEWIWQNKSLPEKDPFSFTTTPHVYEKERWAPFMLKQYWLSQIITYGIYSMAGLQGIVAFRVLIYLGITSILYIYMRRRGAGMYTAIFFFFFVPVLITFNSYTVDRPQAISYLMAVVLFFLIEDLKNRLQRPEVRSDPNPDTEKCPKSGFKFNVSMVFLPIVMILWANMHGGFILGIIIIAIYLIAEIVNIARGKKKASSFLPILFFSVLVSLLNPNLYKAIPAILEIERSLAAKTITEFFGPIHFASELNDYFLITIVAVMSALYSLSVIANLIRAKKWPEISHLLLFLFLTSLSLSSKRYIPFLVFIGMPIIASGLSGITDRGLKRVEGGARAFIFVAILFISLIIYIYPKTVFNIRPLISEYYFPINAVDFIKGNNIEGNVFNNYEWGGYLLWELRSNGIFIDTRGIDYGMIETYGKVEGCSKTPIMGIPEWKTILNAYRIEIVFMRSISLVGSMPKIIPCLVTDEEWKLVYQDPMAFIFIRDPGTNSALIEKYSMPKEMVYAIVRDTAYSYLRTNPSNPLLWITVGRAALGMDMPEDALEAFERAIWLRPDLRQGKIGLVVDDLKTGGSVKAW